MLDKVVYINDKEVRLIFTHRSPVTLYSSDGNVLELLDEMLCPINSTGAKTLTEYKANERISDEDTIPFPLGIPEEFIKVK